MSDTVYQYELITIDDRQNGDFSAKNILVKATGSVVGQLEGENVRIEGQQMGEITAGKAAIGPKAILRNCVLNVGQLAAHPDATWKRCVLYLDTPARTLDDTVDEALGDALAASEPTSPIAQTIDFYPTPAPLAQAVVSADVDEETSAMLERELGLGLQEWAGADIAKVENLTSELQALSELVRRESLASEARFFADSADDGDDDQSSSASADEDQQTAYGSRLSIRYDADEPAEHDVAMQEEVDDSYRRLPSLFS